MRGRQLIPIAFVIAVLVALPAVAFTETGIEKDVKRTLGFDLGECTPATNLASPWRQGPNLDVALDELRTGVLNGKVYLVGGTTGVTGIQRDHPVLIPSDRLIRFDPRTQKYEDLAPMPRGLNHVSVVPYRDMLYVLGGYGRLIDANTSSSFFRYDPQTDRWSRMPDLPVPRAAAAAGILDNRLVIATGAHDSKPRPDAFAFDFSTRSWSRLPSIPTKREHVGSAVLGGKLYVLGGRTSTSLAVNTAERYDSEIGRWERLPPMPVPSGGVSAVTSGSKVIAVGGGNDGAGTVTGAVQKFDPRTGIWTRLPDLRTPRHGHGAAVAGGRIWVFGGSDCAYFSATDSVESLPAPDTGNGS